MTGVYQTRAKNGECITVCVGHKNVDIKNVSVEKTAYNDLACSADAAKLSTLRFFESVLWI